MTVFLLFDDQKREMNAPATEQVKAVCGSLDSAYDEAVRIAKEEYQKEAATPSAGKIVVVDGDRIKVLPRGYEPYWLVPPVAVATSKHHVEVSYGEEVDTGKAVMLSFTIVEHEVK
jgi:hypothetical protein